MPQMQLYKVVLRTVDGETWTSRVNATMVSDDMGREQVAEAIDNQIMTMWHQTLANGQPFQFGILENDVYPARDSLIVHPDHVVWAKLVMLELRPATEEEVAARQPPTMPEMHFLPKTGQPPADGEGLPAGSQPA